MVSLFKNAALDRVRQGKTAEHDNTMTRWFGFQRGGRREFVVLGASQVKATRIGLVVPILILVSVLVGLTLYCDHLLQSAAEGQALRSGSLPLYVAAGCFLFAASVVVVLQSMNVAQRVAGPEYRLIQSLRRIRAGDASFRIHLRRGDLLHGLAEECNALLDWINTNPPVGVQTGTDVFELAELDSEKMEMQP